MGGLGKLFSRIIPIIMLVCFVCLGITHTFNQTGINAENKTYLTTQTINTGTQENPNNITYYNFDINSYLSNINVNMLKEATNKAIDTETLTTNINTFNTLWQNGYRIGVLTQTILNAILLSINILITIINLLLIIPRIISGIILTGMSLIGINISTNGIITTSLKTILSFLAIPLINPTEEQNGEIYNSLAGTTWYFNETQTINIGARYNFTFTSNGQTFDGINIERDNGGLVPDAFIQYINRTTNTTKTVYSERFGKWNYGNLNNAYRTITIDDTLNNNNNTKIHQWLSSSATQIQNRQENEQKSTENTKKTEDNIAIIDKKKYILAY